jgi:sugar lactone lactonase YvrE
MRAPARIAVAFFMLCLFRMSVSCARVDVIDAQARYPEGPLWDQGRLLYVEYAGGDIKMWDGKQSQIYWRKDHCGPNALIHFRDDHILVACYDGNYLVELDASIFRHQACTTSRRRLPEPSCICQRTARTHAKLPTPYIIPTD